MGDDGQLGFGVVNGPHACSVGVKMSKTLSKSVSDKEAFGQDPSLREPCKGESAFQVSY